MGGLKGLEFDIGMHDGVLNVHAVGEGFKVDARLEADATERFVDVLNKVMAMAQGRAWVQGWVADRDDECDVCGRRYVDHSEDESRACVAAAAEN